MRSTFRQIGALVSANVRAIPSRLSASSVAMIGIAGVALILVSLLSIAQGFHNVLEGSGSDDVIIITVGSPLEVTSHVTVPQITIIKGTPGIKVDGIEPRASAEIYTTVDVRLQSDGQEVNASLRGLEEHGPELRRGFKITAGRMFVPGKFEAIVGREAAGQFANMKIGDHILWGRSDWQIVGIFAAHGSVAESEIWTNLSTLQSALSFGPDAQSVRARLVSPGTLPAVIKALQHDPRLDAHVITERALYSEQSRQIVNIINRVGYVVAVIMGVAAVFGALNATYAAISARSREIATLRAIGFGTIAIVLSVMAEATLLGLIGAGVGSLVASFGADGAHFSTLNFATNSQVAFVFAVTPAFVAQGLIYGCMLGFISSVPPCIQAACLPITVGLHRQ